MARDRHLSVVRSAEEDHAATMDALRQVAQRVPYQMQPSYDWDSTYAQDLFFSLNHVVAHGVSLPEVEDALGMPGLHRAYLRWLEHR